ncbi:MAG TPA: glycosyltransferase family 4 protein [Rhodopila sp.]
MRIAMIAGYYPPDVRGGGEISTQLLAQLLARAGCDVQVITCGLREEQTIDGPVTVRRMLSPNIYWNYRTRASLPKKLVWHLGENINPRARARLLTSFQEIRPDLVLTSTIENFGAEAWLAPASAGIPCIHILRSYYPFCWRGNAVHKGSNCEGHCLDCAVLTAGRKRASQHVNGVVGISRYILARHRDQGFFRSASTALIPEPISCGDPPRRTRTDAVRRFGYLGVLSRDKGLETLAAAWIKAGTADARLVIAGTGQPDYEAALRQAFPSDVSFAGWVDSERYLAELDFLIVPSVWNEPFGRIVIEAFAQGVPVIGSRIAGIAETINDGETGFTFPPGDVDALAATIRMCASLSDAGHQRLSERAREDVRRYDSELVGQAHVGFYNSVIRQYRAAVSTPTAARPALP